MRVGGETRSEGALQDGRSGEPGLPGERARRGNEKEKEKESVAKERGVPHGSQAATKRKVTPKRWHAAACRLCRNGFLCLDITGSFAGTYMLRKLFSLVNTNMYVFLNINQSICNIFICWVFETSDREGNNSISLPWKYIILLIILIQLISCIFLI